MAVTASTTVPAPVEQVVATFADEAFVRHVAEKAGATLESFEVSGATTGAFTVTTVRAMSSERLPEVARRFVGASVHLTQTDAYEAPAADGSRVVRSDITVASLTVSGSADQTLRAQGEHGLGFCNITKCCTEVCPEHIKITDNALIPMKERVADRKYDPIVWLGNKLFRR